MNLWNWEGSWLGWHAWREALGMPSDNKTYLKWLGQRS